MGQLYKKNADILWTKTVIILTFISKASYFWPEIYPTINKFILEIKNAYKKSTYVIYIWLFVFNFTSVLYNCFQFWKLIPNLKNKLEHFEFHSKKQRSTKHLWSCCLPKFNNTNTRLIRWICSKSALTYFISLVSFFTPWKHKN